MTGDAPDIAPIQTPVELDLIARDVQRQAGRSGSPLFRFTTITAFFRRSGHLPPLWTGSYFRTLYPIFSAAIRHEYVCWVDPEEWLTALRALRLMKDAEWAAHESTFAETESTAWEKTCLCLSGMGAFRHLHELLRAQGWAHADLSVREWSTVLNAHTVGLDAFNEYCEALRRQGDCPPFLRRARERWDHHRADGAQPGVLLLDGKEASTSTNGLVLHLSVDAKRSVSTRVHFRNPLDEQNTVTMRQLSDAALAATALATEHFRRRIPQYEWTVGFHEHEASYSGESMGIAGALSMAHRIQKDMNRALRWQLRPNLVCTGGIDAAGQVRALPDAVIPAKVRCAFFSPADSLVLPAANAEQARLEAWGLQQRYPERRFQIQGVASLDDCLAAPDIVRVLHRTVYDRVGEFTRAHAVLLLAVLVLLLASAGVYFWWKSLYGYPDLEYTTVTGIEENALVYNPHRAEHWQFRDYNVPVRRQLPFGDLEIGADATRNVYIWNMTPAVLDVRLGIEGPQADQWYISWHGGDQFVNPTDSLRVMIKYAPDREAQANLAYFTVRDPSSGALLTQLRLTGSAGPPLSAGYALAFDGVDDMLFFGERALAFARDEGTIEWWMRMDSTHGAILSNLRNTAQTPTMRNMVIAIAADTLDLAVGNRNNRFRLPRPVTNTGRWHHLALAYSREKSLIRFFIDGDMLFEHREEFIIEAATTPFVTIGAYFNGQSMQAPLRGAIDELRVWDTPLDADTIRARMRRRVNAFAPGLIGCWDFDVIAEVSAHNANKRTQDGILRGRPTYIRSRAPIGDSEYKIRIVGGPAGRPAVMLPPFSWLQCGRDVIDTSAERSYAIRFRRDGHAVPRILTVMNQDASVTMGMREILLTGAAPREIPTREGWNSAVARVNRAHELELFINGKFVAKMTNASFRAGPSYRYEGLQIGMYNDKYNNFGHQAITYVHEELRHPRIVADFRVWRRTLTDADVASYERGASVPDGLAAHWPLDTLPDPDGNYRDVAGGHLMHLWRYRAWE